MLMNDWKKLKWGDIATLEYGKALQGYQRDNGKYPVYGTNGKIGTTDTFLCSFPGVVVGRKGAYRSVHFSKTPFYVIDTAFYIKPKIEELDLLFAYYQLLTVDINFMDSGSAIPSTSREDFYDIDILLPPIEQQKKISVLLASLDDKIDLLHRENKTLEQLAETLYRQWFEEQSEKNIKVSDHAIISTGKGLMRHEFVKDGKYPILGANGEIGRTDKYLTDERLILTGRVGTLGKVYISTNKVWISDNVLIIKNYDEIYFFPLYFFLKRFDFENLNTGSTQPLVTQGDMRKLEMNIPSSTKMQQFHTYCSSNFKKIEENINQMRILVQLRNNLLPKFVNSELGLH